MPSKFDFTSTRAEKAQSQREYEKGITEKYRRKNKDTSIVSDGSSSGCISSFLWLISILFGGLGIVFVASGIGISFSQNINPQNNSSAGIFSFFIGAFFIVICVLLGKAADKPND